MTRAKQAHTVSARQPVRARQLFSILPESAAWLVNAERCAPENETDEVIFNIPKMSQYLSCEKTPCLSSSMR